MRGVDDSKQVKMSGEVSVEGATEKPAEATLVSGGDAGAVHCSIPSFAAASELLSTPYSCLVTNTHRRHLSLPPMYLNKKKTGIQEELQAELLRFSQSLKGVPLAYDNIRIIGQHGDIHDDSGYIHMDIVANFIVFQPKKGQKLLGRVNKLGVSHVGCLVHGCFNASIPKPSLVPLETWRDAGPRIGEELEFEVIALDADTVGVLLIRGRLGRTRVQELLAVGESSESTVTVDQPQTPEVEPKLEPNPEPTEDSPVDTPKKKKKKKKDKIKEEEEVTSLLSGQLDSSSSSKTVDLNGTMDEANGNEPGEKKKKKKKKDKHLKEEEEVINISAKEVHGSDSSGYLSDKPSKKRKRESTIDVTPCFSDDSEPKKSKKKRKSGIQQS